MIPIKCQVCPHFYDIGNGFMCHRVRCELIDNHQLRKQVYKLLETIGGDLC